MIFIRGTDTLEDVIAIRDKILANLITNIEGGGTVVSWSSEGTSVTRSFPVSSAKLLEEIALFIQLENGTGIKRLSPFYV